MPRIHQRVLGLLVVALLAGASALRAQEEMPVTLDEAYARLAERIPGFGGLYLDEEGTTHVYLQDLSLAREVQDLGERVEVHQGQYDFRDLFSWKERVRTLLSREGLLSLDIDEQRNRLVLGAEAGSVEALRAGLPVLLRDLRVPPEAVVVEAGDLPVPLELLTDRIRPVPGGVRISTSTSICTLGVNVTRAKVRGFVTNSHCTDTWSEVEGTVFFQRSSFTNADQIGVETVDPPYFQGSPCPVGRKCRYSDAAFVSYDDPGFSGGGNIANPILCGLSAGTSTVNPGLPRLPVTGFLLANPPSGSVVYKVGQTTGCTFGSLKETCQDSIAGVLVNGTLVATNVMRLCQNRVSGVSANGDSGSPVFTQKNGKATLLGLLWGGGSGYFTYSPWAFVASELGVLMPDAP